MTLDESFKLVAQMHHENYTHARTLIKLQDQTPEKILRHANEEMFELGRADAVWDWFDNKKGLVVQAECLEELADTLGCLFHYAVKSNFTVEQIANELKRKLELRHIKP